MRLFVLAGSAKIDKLTSLFAHWGSADEVLVLCATIAQEGDIGRAYARFPSDKCDDAGYLSSCSLPDLRVMNLGGYVSSLWNRWGDDRALLGTTVRMRFIEQILTEGEVPLALQTSGGKALLSRLAATYVPATDKMSLPVQERGTHKYRAIEKLLIRYHHKLKDNGYIEHQYAMHMLAAGIADKSIVLDHKNIAVSGFSDFTPLQTEFVCACARGVKTSGSVTVILDWESDNLATEYTSRTLNQLIERGAKTIDIDLSVSQNDCVLTLGKAQGFAAETALIADFAWAEHQEHPERSKALLVSRTQCYLRPIAHELERRGIPYELDVKTPFGASGLGAALLALLRICANEDPQENALAFAMSAYSGLRADDALDLDTRWRRYRTDAKSILTQLTYHESEACADLRLIRSGDMSAHIADWGGLVNGLYARGAQNRYGSTFDMLQDAAAQKTATAALQELYEEKLAYRSKDLQPDAAIDRNVDDQPGNKILRYDPRITAAELYVSLREAQIVQTPKPASPAILLTQPARVFGRKFHSVIVGGLSADDQAEMADNPLDLRIAAYFAGTKLSDISEQEQFSHYATVATAQERLYLVAQHETLSGEELKPGGLLSFVEEGEGEVSAEIPCVYKHNDDVIADQSFASAEKQMDIEQILRSDKRSSIKLLQPSRGKAEHFDLGYREGIPVSATTLQDYANCPYHWLLHRFVDGGDIEQGFDVRRQGIFAHEVLKAFYQELPKQEIGKRITKENLDTAANLYHEIFDSEVRRLEQEITLTPEEQSNLILIRKDIEIFLSGEVEYAPEFVPSYFEFHFGMGEQNNGSPEPVDLGIGLPVKGVIDRVDVRADDRAALVIDYKRSTKITSLDYQVSNNVFQGLLYRFAAEKALDVHPVSHSFRTYGGKKAKSIEVYSQDDNPDERPLGLPRSGRGRKVWGHSEKTMRKGFDVMMNNARDAVDGLCRGQIERRESKLLCRYCLYEGCEHKPDEEGWQ